MKAPLVQGDDDSTDNIGAVDSRQPRASPNGPTATEPPGAASATLTQRLSKKLSAIPAYLQTANDPEALRLASAEPSNSSLSGYACLSCFWRAVTMLLLLLCADLATSTIVEQGQLSMTVAANTACCQVRLPWARAVFVPCPPRHSSF